MLPSLGSFALHAAFVVAALGIVSSVLAGQTGKKRYTTLAVYSGYIVFGLIASAATIYVHSIVTHDFSLQNVYRYSDTRMPLNYLMTAFWGGQAGSLLFWTTVLASYFALALTIHRKKDASLIPGFITVIMGLVSILLFILLFASNPFETWHIIDTPKEGSGLNPLLQTPLMMIHPPSLLQGFATMAIPFAFTMSALIAGRFDNEWLKVARRWTLVSWLWLSMGNMLGGMWAYEELGWGGYWAWDPVENAALLPWLAGTAFLHSIMVQERRGMLKRWNVVLSTIAFLLTVFGTFITRSGLIDSVHTFAQSSIGNYFAAFLLITIAFSTSMLIWRWKHLKSDANIDSPMSREAVFLGNNWILLGMVFVVIWGTLFPKISEMITGDKVSIGPPWYNKYIVPMGIVLVLLIGVGTLITWKKASLKNFQRNFLVPVGATLVATPVVCALFWFTRVEALDVETVPLDLGYATAGVTFSIFVIMTIIFEFWRGMSARMTSKGENALEAVLGLFDRQRRRYGGYIVHLGFVMAIVAFCGNAFKVEQDVSMRQGESVPLGDYEVTYEGLGEKEDRNRVLIYANLSVKRGGVEVARITPGRAIYHSFPDSPTSEIAIDSSPIEDLYFALVGYSEGGNLASFKMVVSPLTWWFWFGVAILVFGTVICLWPEEVRMPETIYRRAARTVASTAMLALLSATPLVFHATVGSTQTGPAAHEEHEEVGDGKSSVRVHDPRLGALMDVIRVDCPSSGRPTMTNSAPTCTDYQKDLRLLEKLIGEGKTDKQILDHFVAMRGPEVLAMPTNEGFNWLSWALPIGLLLIAAPLIGLKVRKWSRETAARELATPNGAPSDAYDEGYRRLLEKELDQL